MHSNNLHSPWDFLSRQLNSQLNLLSCFWMGRIWDILYLFLYLLLQLARCDYLYHHNHSLSPLQLDLCTQSINWIDRCLLEFRMFYYWFLNFEVVWHKLNSKFESFHSNNKNSEISKIRIIQISGICWNTIWDAQL